MKKRGLRRSSSGGYTLLEMMVAVAIIGILVAISVASYDTVKARIRYSQIRADMDGLIQAAYTDYTSSRDNTWALNVALPGQPPSFVGAELKKWPTPPCPHWFYNYENYSAVPSATLVRITIHRADGSSIWSSCLENYGNDCMVDAGSGAPVNLTTIQVAAKYVYCSE